MTEPQNERMNLPQWDGHPSGWRDYQQEVRLYKTSENLEVNWSVATRLVGGLKGAARRVGLAMTDHELSPTARNIPDDGERRETETVGAELGQQRPHRKRVKVSRCSSPRTSSRENGASVSRTASRGLRRASRLSMTMRSIC